MVENVENIHAELEVISLSDGEALHEREIPILLERPSINIAVQRAELGGAGRSRGIGCASSRVGNRSGCEIVDVDVTIEALVNVSMSETVRDGTAGSEVSTQGSE